MSEAADTSYGSVQEQSPGFLMACSIKSIALKFPHARNISTSVLDTWLSTPDERTVAILDCRLDEEFDVSHINEAVAVGHKEKSVEELVNICEEKLNDKPNPTVVCYCSVGYRSSDIAQQLSAFYKKSGKQLKPEVYNLEGSLFKWAQERRPMIDKNGQTTPFVHPYNKVFGKLIDKQFRKEHL